MRQNLKKAINYFNDGSRIIQISTEDCADSIKFRIFERQVEEFIQISESRPFGLSETAVALKISYYACLFYLAAAGDFNGVLYAEPTRLDHFMGEVHETILMPCIIK